MANSGARIFVPPYQDPNDPNTAPEVMETMAFVCIIIGKAVVKHVDILKHFHSGKHVLKIIALKSLEPL